MSTSGEKITRITLSKKTIVSPQLNNRQRLNIELLRLNFSECYRGKPFVFIDRLYLKRVELLQLRNGTILLNDHLLGRNKGPFLYGDLDKCLRYISKEHYKYVFIGRKRYVKRQKKQLNKPLEKIFNFVYFRGYVKR